MTARGLQITRSTRQLADGHRGFALVVTVSVLMLLAVVAVALLSLSTLTVRSANQDAAQSEARANARLALMLALGELQKAMGPDMRISARAETLAQHPGLKASVPANSPKAWWVGASHSDPGEGLDPERPLGDDNPGVVWLISGLDPDASPGSQISAGQPFAEPVDMYGDKTIDTATMTGGSPIQAGSVMIANSTGRNSGGFAYFIDDNGMKAQLAASNPQVRNNRRDPLGGGVLPGTYDLSILEGMSDLEETPVEDYNKLLSLNDLPLIGADVRIARTKRLGYTTLSRGVLSDVRKGGLKRDLTIAFENDRTFESVFPRGRGNSFGERYLIMDEEKFAQSRELQTNGYIHWEMFKDYYNTKKYIKTRNRTEYLDAIMITKEGLFNREDTPFKRGELGPHAIGPNNDTHSLHRQMPYGDYQPIAPPSQTGEYKHSPVIPVLSRMQQNAWVERRPQPRGQRDRIRTNVQLWKAQYNPYNIGLNVVGDQPRYGPRVIHYPQVRFTIQGMQLRNRAGGSSTTLVDKPGFSGKRQSSVPREILLQSGRAHVYAFKDYGEVGRDNDEFLYDDGVKNLTLQSIYSEYELISAPRTMTLEVDFVLERPSMMHGANSNSYNASHEVSQTMWAPFAWESIDRRYPGKTITKPNLSLRDLNENTMASFSFHLRTTREGSGAIRPLVDANIRCLFANTKWDSPLGVPLLAAYSAENAGEVDEQIFQMNTQDAPKGYTFWGGGQDPVDGHDRVILFDIPRVDLVSLGQLQHANIGRFSYEPSYIVGNSYANLRIPLDEWKAAISDTFSTAERGLQEYAIRGRFNLYDASYIVNEALWDSYIFTTIPQVRDNFGRVVDLAPTDATFESLRAGKLFLPNPRFLPYEPAGSTFDRATLQMASTPRGERGSFYHNAGHLMVDGSFNVNSTSVDAWEAFLSGTHGLPYRKLNRVGAVGAFGTDADGVRFPRVTVSHGGPTERDSLDHNYWTGFRSLDPEEVRELAEAVVEEVKKRGPFLTFGEFVNRRLEDSELGERGALQAALDVTVNKDLDSSFEDDATHRQVPADSTQGAGFPGQLLQGDILQALSPYMTVRSDTFTIRAYGESRAPGSNEVRARAWCEATVQRYPDPVPDDESTRDALEELVDPSSKFGRTFRIVSFRWLSPNEI